MGRTKTYKNDRQEKALKSKENKSLIENYASDSIRAYLKEIGRIPLLTVEEEYKLALQNKRKNKVEKCRKEIEKREEERATLRDIANELEIDIREVKRIIDVGTRAKEKLIEANLRLVVSIAKRQINKGVPIQDLIQEGTLGLIKALEKFDPERGFKFSTYATWWIRQYTNRAVVDQSKCIRIPIHLHDLTNKVKAVIREYYDKNHKMPTNEYICNKLSISMRKLRNVLNTVGSTISLDIPVVNEDDMCIVDFIAWNGESPEDYIDKLETRTIINKSLETLNIDEKEIIEYRYGLTDNIPKTLDEISLVTGFTREKVRQIETSAIRKLRYPLRNLGIDNNNN